MVKGNLPNFFIIGTVKGGTTSLYEYLKQHPQVFMSEPKEPHFFANIVPSYAQRHIVTPIADKDQYLALFERAVGFKAVGEASTSYLWEENAPLRIKEWIPDPRIIILLRNPIQRAFSHYLMDVREGWQNLSFYDALLEDYNAPEKGYGISHLYVELGMYYEQTRRYLETFGTDSVLILSFDDLNQNPHRIIEAVARHLGIQPEPLDRVKTNVVHNAFATPRNNLAKSIIASYTFSALGRASMPKFLRSAIKQNILLSKAVPKPELDTRAVKFLSEIYGSEMERLRELIGWAPYQF